MLYYCSDDLFLTRWSFSMSGAFLGGYPGYTMGGYDPETVRAYAASHLSATPLGKL